MSGEETRSNLQQRAGDLAGTARDLADQGRERLRSTVSAVREKAERIGGSVREATGTEPSRNL